jgi:hypothetical protein
MSAVGLASSVTRIDAGAVAQLVANGLPIIVSEIVLTGSNTVALSGQFVFLNADDLSTLFTATIRASSILTIDVHFMAHRGLAVTTPTGGSVTITHSQPGR